MGMSVVQELLAAGERAYAAEIDELLDKLEKSLLEKDFPAAKRAIGTLRQHTDSHRGLADTASGKLDFREWQRLLAEFGNALESAGKEIDLNR